MQQEERFSGLRYKEDYLKNAQRKFMKNFGGNKEYKTVGATFTKIAQTCFEV